MATKNGKIATAEIDAKTLLGKNSSTAVNATDNDNWEELDYTPCKSVYQAMLIMHGERVDHPESVKGLCAIGKVLLQVGDKRIDFGLMSRESLSLSPEAMALCYDCGFESEDIIAIIQDAKKAWCLGFKSQEAIDKTNRDNAKRQSKIDKQKALLDRLKKSSK